MLTNPRALKLTRTRDNLWLRILDVREALEARTYAAPGSLVLEVSDDLCEWNAGRWRLEVSPEGVTCVPSEASADLSLSVNELGSLYLGGVRAGVLASAGRIGERSDGAAPLLDALLRPDRAPHNAVGF